MIRIIGENCLYFALLFSLVQFALPAIGHLKQNPYLKATARPACWAQFAFVTNSFIFLTIAFVQSDFSIVYVAANSHPSLPLMYRLTAVWGAHEGSMLLWVLVLNIWSLIFSFVAKDKTLLTLTLSVLGFISAAFLCFLIFTSSPFIAADAALSGNDLNPLLQDPGFVFHPPMLYLGYVGFSTAFSITLAALLSRHLNEQWVTLTRQFALAAWCCLTLGICLGSWWAYRVLGWGGFWFWDPVENASLLPWLTGIALIHVLVLFEKKQIGLSWAVILAILSFTLSLLGTFLVRSGVLLSVHSFANDPKRGLFLLLLLAIVLTISLLIYLLRTPKPKRVSFSLLSRETLLLLNSVILFIAAMTIVLATLYPIILESFDLGSISVGAPYFNTVMAPLTLILLFFMGLGPLCRWQDQSAARLWHLSWKKLGMSLILAIVIFVSVIDQFSIGAFLSLSLSIWVIISIKDSWRLHPGMSLAHIGFATLIIGVMLSSLLSVEREVILSPGQSSQLGPYRFVFIETNGIKGSNYRGIVASFEVTKKDRHITNLYPEKRIYQVRDMVMTNAAIHPSLFRDLYLAVGQPMAGSKWSFRIYYKPFIRLIWLGGILMMLGGTLAIIRRKKS